MPERRAYQEDNDDGGDPDFYALLCDLVDVVTAATDCERATTVAVLCSVPDGWARVDGHWIKITSDGVGYGEFDRAGKGGD